MHLQGLGIAAVLVGCSFDPPQAAPSDGPGLDAVDAPDAPVDQPGSARVTAGLVGLWTFDEGTGTQVGDQVAMPVHLAITDPSQITWGAGTLQVNGPANINSGFTTRNRILDACEQSSAVTMEVWATPSNITQDGTITGQPARVVSFGPANAGNHDISIGQHGALWAATVRTSNAAVDQHGNPELVQPATGATAHLVVTFDGQGRRFYVDGQVVSDTLAGTLAPWDPFHGLSFAGDPAGRNTWRGTLHLVAIYARALDVSEVMQNFEAGPETE